MKLKRCLKKMVRKYSPNLRYLPNDPKFLEVCEKAVEDCPSRLEYLPDHFKMQEMCGKAVEDGPWCL